MKKCLFCFLLSLTTLSFMIGSCSKESRPTSLQSKNVEFLDISTTDIHSFTPDDIVSFAEALNRLEFYVEKGTIGIRTHSCEDVQVSSRIYNLVSKMIDKDKPVSLASSLFTRFPVNTDCVAMALYWWGGYSYEAINGYIVSNYGTDGVPSEHVFDVIRHFHPNARAYCVGDTSWTMPQNVSVQTSMGYYLDPSIPGNAHMVNVASIDSVTWNVTYLDFQNDGTIGAAALSSFNTIYTKN